MKVSLTEAEVREIVAKHLRSQGVDVDADELEPDYEVIGEYEDSHWEFRGFYVEHAVIRF